MPKILIADDEPYIRYLIEEALEEFEDEGVELFFAEDGRQAVEMIQKEHPQLVFLDVMMPHKNGFEVCEIIKSDPKFRDSVYIIMLTAKGQEFDKKKGLEAGTDEYLTKPFNPISIIPKVRKLLDMG